MFGKRQSVTVNALILIVLSTQLLNAGRVAQAQTETVLYGFDGGSDGANPYGGLVFTNKGNLYGTTGYGGTYSYGTVFELNAAGVEKVLYSFGGRSGDGVLPEAGLVIDRGNFYGTTAAGGAYGGAGGYGDGTVFKLTPAGKETVLHSFNPEIGDGEEPIGSLVFDKDGNLYGTTFSGGAYGYGTVFKLTLSAVETVLHSFNPEMGDGANPIAGLVFDTKGNLYGTTRFGGAYGDGTVFMLSLAGSETVLYSFTGGVDGGAPYAGTLVFDKKGNLYGTTSGGGTDGFGTVFKLTPAGAESVLHSFTSDPDGAYPYGGLVLDKEMNLYGTTAFGGASGIGAVFEVTPTGTETVLHSFTGIPDGTNPQFGRLIWDALGNLYGTAWGGGSGTCGRDGCGAVFKITP
jgi:uncharacterized repeat protein (TIGR03803 family)